MSTLNDINIQNLKKDAYLIFYPDDSLIILSQSMDNVEKIDLTDYSQDDNSELRDNLTKFFRKQNSTSFTFLSEFLKHFKKSSVTDPEEYVESEEFLHFLKCSYFYISSNYRELTFLSQNVLDIEENYKGFFVYTSELDFYIEVMQGFCLDILTNYSHLFLKEQVSVQDYVQYVIENLVEQDLLD